MPADGPRVTHVGGPTALVEFDGLRVLTDPTFDAPGRRYAFGWGTGSRKTAGPAVAPADLPALDAVLLSHDHHADNLDDEGRALLPSAGVVLTTVPGARRLGGNAVGLAPGATAALPNGWEVTATPARHGPPLSRPVAGEVVGFALRRAGADRVALWISGDTVPHRALSRFAEGARVDVALLHLGAVRFGLTGPVRYTMTGREAVELCGLLRPRVVVPVHHEGWSHFRERREAVERAFERAPAAVGSALRWLPPGRPVEL
ncbi:MBL fold metallo-hydrolase [Saccharothrix sp. BKS2]|uniref:MBL fold metallo-hydrolase n=1 Tax=Saccharothrix sp. BKS2 TaxID=3064400 RepID=UPI0039ECFE47